MGKREIIVIGGSAGSGAALRKIVAGLPPDFASSVFIVTHLPANSQGYLAENLARETTLPVRNAVDGQPIEPGRIYVGVPDRHLMVTRGAVQLGRGPRENMVRPSIDPLFRSAALHYGPKAIAVILSGMLNDGAAGLSGIKACGGIAIVQHPLDAEVDQMPLAALEAVDVDHVAAAEQIPQLLVTLAQGSAGAATAAPEHIAVEVAIASGARLGSERLRSFARPAPLTCPDCGGVLSEIKGEHPLRYRCQTGHAHTAEILATQRQDVDEAIRVALRVMEERVELVSRMSRDARETGRSAVADLYERRAVEYGEYADTLRRAAITNLRLEREGLGEQG
jgi:two-component system, chemotaxis family, protein-glutamate methylesterase/glutaminase